MPVTTAKKPEHTKRGKDEPAMSAPSKQTAAAVGESDIVTVSGIQWRFLRLYLAGAELYTNKLSDLYLDEYDTKVKPTKPRTWDEEWIYKNHICYGHYDMSWHLQNLYGFPAVGLKKAIVQTILDTAQQKERIIKCRMSKFLFISGAYDGLVPITKDYVRDDKHADYVAARLTPVDRRQAARNSSKQMFPVHRPLYHDWKMTVDLRYGADVLSEQTILNAVANTGALAGFGSNSIGVDGTGGAFRLEAIDRLPNTYKFSQFRYDDAVTKPTAGPESLDLRIVLLPPVAPLQKPVENSTPVPVTEPKKQSRRKTAAT